MSLPRKIIKNLRFLKKYRTFMVLNRRFQLRTCRPDWESVLENSGGQWKAALDSAKSGKKVLIATSMGASLATTLLDSVLAAALTLRGADVHVLLCDSSLPACTDGTVEYYKDINTFVRHGQKKDLCKDCFSTAYKMFSSLGVKVHRYGDNITDDEMKKTDELASRLSAEELCSYKHDGMAIGEHAIAGALRFYARGGLDGSPEAEAVLRRYFKSSLLAALATTRLLKKTKFEAVMAHHGIYVPQGPVCEAARKAKVRVVTWVTAYRKKTFIFSHDDTYHHTMMSEPVGKWQDIAWTEATDAFTLDYLKSRWYGKNDWISFVGRPEFDMKGIASEVGADFSKPCIGLLTNVMWDAQLHYPANIFENMLEWIIDTIKYFESRPDLQLIIRVHPAEIRGRRPSLQPIVEEIKKRFKAMPGNVFIIPPESEISTYAVMHQCDSVIIYGTKTGVELTSMGIPVIVAGEAWIRNKGISIDPSTQEQYFSILQSLPLGKRMDDDKVTRAKKYAFHFFFRRMIPLEFMEPLPEHPATYMFKFKSVAELAPGMDKGLDVICSGILNGSDFIYPYEKYI